MNTRSKQVSLYLMSVIIVMCCISGYSMFALAQTCPTMSCIDLVISH